MMMMMMMMIIIIITKWIKLVHHSKRSTGRESDAALRENIAIKTDLCSLVAKDLDELCWPKNTATFQKDQLQTKASFVAAADAHILCGYSPKKRLHLLNPIFLRSRRKSLTASTTSLLAYSAQLRRCSRLTAEFLRLSI